MLLNCSLDFDVINRLVSAAPVQIEQANEHDTQPCDFCRVKKLEPGARSSSSANRLHESEPAQWVNR